ncbi:MAG: T9SS type A sorting domain-containing protein, partial [Bacteroidota bacterium]
VLGSSELTVNGTVIVHKTLTTEASSTLTIPATNVLNLSPTCQATIPGTLNNVAGTAGLVVSSDATGTGSLILNTAGVAGTVQRFISHWTDDNHGWHLLSSPVSGQAVQPEFVPSTPDNTQDFYAWDEVNGWWFNSKDPSMQWVSGFDASFAAGKGYLVAYKTDMTKNFTGTALNVSNVPKSGLTYTNPGNYSGTSIDPGWNLLGNPFSSAITWNTAGWGLTNLATTAKVWNESNASYADLDVAGMIIPPHQGFMVQVLDASGGSLTIPAAARVHSSQSWYKSSDLPLIRLMAHNISAQTAQESTVIFDSQAKPGFDPSADSRFFPGYAPLFYSVEGTEKLSTNVLPGIDAQAVIPFSFVKTAGTAYSIEAVKIENIPSTVYLTDLKLDKTQNLNENPLYTFTSGAGDNPARFVLTFSQTGIGEKTAGGREIYTYGNNLYVANPGNSRIEVFNLTGQLLLNEQVNCTGLYKTSLSLPTGYYMVRLTSATGVLITKVFIQS